MSERETCPVCDYTSSALHSYGVCPNAAKDREAEWARDLGDYLTAREHLAARPKSEPFAEEQAVLFEEGLAEQAVGEYERRYHRHRPEKTLRQAEADILHEVTGVLSSYLRRYPEVVGLADYFDVRAATRLLSETRVTGGRT